MTPEEVSGINESFPADAPKLKILYLVLVAVLGIALLFGLVAWLVLALRGTPMPEGMAVIVGAISGGLLGVLAGPVTKGDR